MIYQVPAFTPRGPSLAAMLAGQHPPLPAGKKTRVLCLDEDSSVNESNLRECKVCGELKDLDCFYNGRRKSGSIRYDRECKKCRNARNAKPANPWKPNPAISLLTRRMTVREFATLAKVKPSRARPWLDAAYIRGLIGMQKVGVLSNNDPAVYFFPLESK